MKIAIVGRKQDTENYVRYVQAQGYQPVVTLDPKEAASCGRLILPGGGDIAPALFGETVREARKIDTELDILQLQALELCVKGHIPLLGICKGLQIINVGLGGTLYQDFPTAELHRYKDADQYHETVTVRGSWLHRLYGDRQTVNSAHHQAIRSLGTGLIPVQFCPRDGCIEAVVHETLPILGVQWHPERIDESRSGVWGAKVLSLFADPFSDRPFFFPSRL